MLSPIPSASLANLRQFANKMEKILLVALNDYGNTFVEPKVELGARFGHLVCEWFRDFESLASVEHLYSAILGHLPGDSSLEHCSHESKAIVGDAPLMAESRF